MEGMGGGAREKDLQPAWCVFERGQDHHPNEAIIERGNPHRALSRAQLNL